MKLDQYSSGRAAKKRGAISAGEMTMEATITKSMYLLGKNLDEEEFRKQFEISLAGERWFHNTSSVDFTLVSAIPFKISAEL